MNPKRRIPARRRKREKERGERESSRLIKLYDRSGMTRASPSMSDFRGYSGYYTVTSVCFSGTTAYTFPTAARFPQTLPLPPSPLSPPLIPSRSNFALNKVILEDSSISKKQPVYLQEYNARPVSVISRKNNRKRFRKLL